ncbi:hypothetical protein TNCV_588161 [Trichonephila clavipes]|nr:hypothetical protein TNCV_588161 [Trichonephila clavipes]
MTEHAELYHSQSGLSILFFSLLLRGSKERHTLKLGFSKGSKVRIIRRILRSIKRLGYGRQKPGLDCPTISSVELFEVDDDVCPAPMMADKDILELVQSSKNVINADDAVPVTIA